MGINKLVWVDETVFDISDTTAVPSDVAEGKIFYGADGDQKVGTATGGGGGYSEYAIGGSLVGGTATGYVIDPSVQKIKKYAFAETTSIGRIDIPSGVTLIEDHAFDSCGAEIHGGENAVELGQGAFYGSESASLDVGPSLVKARLNSLSNMPNVEALDLPRVSDFGITPSATTLTTASTFANCTKLASARLDSATWLPPYAFANCQSLASVYIPNVTIIAPYAFTSCPSLTGDGLTLGQVTDIGESAFNLCTAFNARLDLPSVEHVYKQAFSGSELISLKVGSIVQGTLPAFGGLAFLEHLESADTKYKCSTVNASAITSCPKLEDIILPNVNTYNVQAIPQYTMTTALKNIVFKWAGTLSGSTITNGVSISNFPTVKTAARIFYADNGNLLAAYRASSGSVVYIHTVENGALSANPLLTLSDNTSVQQATINGKLLAFKKSNTTSSQKVQVAVIG